MFLEHEVVENKKLNQKFHEITFKSRNSLFSFKPGQFITILVGKNTFRCYSFASSPNELPLWKTFVDITPGGPGTTYLKNIKKGALVKTLDPQGQFLLNNRIKKYIFAATGCGVAPFLSMIKELMKKSDKRIHLIWGLRYEKDITLKKVFESYARLNPNFSFEIILSKPEKSWRERAGHIQGFIPEVADKLGIKDLAIYLSGSREFINEASQTLKSKKFPVRKIYIESCY